MDRLKNVRYTLSLLPPEVNVNTVCSHLARYPKNKQLHRYKLRGEFFSKKVMFVTIVSGSPADNAERSISQVFDFFLK